MDYKNNWEMSKQRFNAFWEREIIDRCCVAVVAPKRNSNFYPESLPSTREERFKYWTDAEWVLKRNLRMFENTYYGGEAFPQIFVNLGAAGHAGFFKNANYRFEDSLWFFPSFLTLDEDFIEFDPNSFLYHKTIEMTCYYVDQSKGRYFVSMPDISGNLDALAHLHGSENLLMNMVLEKHKVHKALDKIQEAWLRVSEEIYQITNENNEKGSTIGWMYTWGPGRHAQMQSDISVMMSPELYNEFVIPELESQISWMDYATYHFDGIDQIKHLDLLLSLENLKMIQWTSVAGQPSPVKYIDVLQRIQKAGKGLLLFTNTEDFEVLMENLSSKGLYLLINADSEDEAKEVERRVEKLTRD